MEVGGIDELRTWILSFGDGALVLEPAALRDAVARELAGALARYRARWLHRSAENWPFPGPPARRRS